MKNSMKKVPSKKAKAQFSSEYQNLKIKYQLLDKKYLSLVKSTESDKKKSQKFIHLLLAQQEEDRKEISRDLHDEIAQLLTGINFELAILSKEAVNSVQILRDRISKTQRLVTHSVDIIHRFARELRPMILDDLGLIPALHSYIKDFMKKTNIQVNLTTFTRISQLSDLNNTVLFRVVQEALTNVARHSKAQNATIVIRKVKKNVLMEIHDNGISFKVKDLRALNRNKRIGLIGMEERVMMAKGSFNVTSNPSHGTSIKIQIPILPRKK